jgi:rhodanese-related sulfurtransferase
MAGVLASAALVAGDGALMSRRNEIDAVTLATWIREQKSGLLVLDVRARADFDVFHIPSAQPVSARAARPDSAQTVVLYGDGVTDASRFAALRAGATRVLVLRGGVRAWLDDIMNPTLPAQATAGQEQEYQRKRALAEYFGGQATRFADPADAAATTEQIIKRLKRRTC